MAVRLGVRVPGWAVAIPWLLVTFTVLFPKGGIKVGPAPLTWGYMILALVVVPLFLVRLLGHPLRQSQLGLASAASLIPFQLLFCYSYLQNGIDNMGYTLAVVTGFFFLPWVFLLVLPSFLGKVDGEKFARHFRFCVLAAAIWGIFLFFYHPIMGKYIEIPYLTVNAGDYGQLEATKHIDRGGYLKLISTYNNGNVYGVATLILLPLYLLLESRRWRRNVLRVALVLTLSRTVWFGLILEQGLSLAYGLPAMLAPFPRIRPGRALKQSVALAATVGLVLGGLFFLSGGLNVLFNAGLGGREGELASFANPTLLPSVALTGFAELLYASALANYGIFGFFSMVLIMLFPLFVIVWKPGLLRSPTKRAAAKGLMIYAVVAGIDGATNLIPVMLFYWFAYMTMLFGLPGEQPSRVGVEGPMMAGTLPVSHAGPHAV